MLEARVNAMGADDACYSCGFRKIRELGATETYLVGTQRWVCADCALRIDAELAGFAYNPNPQPAGKRRFSGDIFDRHFGLCPECGGCDGWKNIGRTHWFYCARHGLKWNAGSNLFDDWRDESMEDWWWNFLFLERLRLCDPCHPKPSRFEWLLDWWHSLGRRQMAVGDEELPF